MDRQGDQDCGDAVTVASWRADVLATVMVAPISLAVLVLALNIESGFVSSFNSVIRILWMWNVCV